MNNKNQFRLLVLCGSILLNLTQLFASTPSFGFIQNVGQVLDQNRTPNHQVLFLLNKNNLQIQLTRKGFSYQISKFIPSTNPSKTPKILLDAKNQAPEGTFQYQRIDVELKGMNNHFEVEMLEQQFSSLNYYNEYTPDFGFEGVHHFNKIIYKSIYPGIDLEFTCSEDFKYNFIIHPGAKIADIQLQYNGVQQLAFQNNTHISIQTSLGTIQEKIPLSYLLFSGKMAQTPIDVSFALSSENTVGFTVGKYPENSTLVIDPSPWATYFGGFGYESGNSIKTDSVGNILVTGYTYSSSGIATSGAFQGVYGGNNDGYLLKFTENGTLVWATYYGGSDNDNTYCLSNTIQGNIVICGITGSKNGIASTNSFKDTLDGITDAFIAKFTANGTRLWATYFGGANLDYGYGICSDYQGNVVISGYTNSLNYISFGAVLQTSLTGFNDCFVAKFSSNGNMLWSGYYGGNNNDYGAGVACDQIGNIYLTGLSSSSTGISTPNSYQPARSGSNVNNDGYLIKLNPNGLKIWGTYFGGESEENARAIAIGTNGELYLIGITQSNAGIATTGAFQTIYKGKIDAFLAKFDTSGAIKWSTYIGGNGDDFAGDIALDQEGKIILAGFTSTETGFATYQAHQEVLKGDIDAFLVKMDTSGARVWSTYFGGTQGEYGIGVSIGRNNYINLVGLSNSSTGIATLGSYQTSLAGYDDCLVIHLTPNGNLNPVFNNVIDSSQTLCKGVPPTQLRGSIPQGGSGNFQYKWLVSTAGLGGPYSAAPGVNTNIHYNPSAQNNPYWVKRSVNSGGDTDTSNAVYINILPEPNANFTANDNVQCANNNKYIFTPTISAADSIIHYFWNLGDGPHDTSLVQTAIKNYALSGMYSVSLSLTNKWGCKDSSSIQVLVQPIPIALAFTNQSNTLCEGDSLLIQCNQLPQIRFKWLRNLLPTIDTGFLVWQKIAGFYSVIQTNNLGCSDTSNAVEVIIRPRPEINILGNSVQEICLHKDSMYILKSAPESLFYYQWQDNGLNISGANTASFSTKKSGNFRVYARNTFGCSDTSENIALNIHPLPTANSINGKSQFGASSTPQLFHCNKSPNHTYEWFLNKVSIKNSTDTFVSIVFSQQGNYLVQMLERTSFNCVTDTNNLNVFVTFPEGLLETSHIQLSIYPNPTRDGVFVQTSLNEKGLLKIFDMKGSCVSNIDSFESGDFVPLASIEPGLYFIHWQTDSGKIVTASFVRE
jgi:hypothetical protein